MYGKILVAVFLLGATISSVSPRLPSPPSPLIRVDPPSPTTVSHPSPFKMHTRNRYKRQSDTDNMLDLKCENFVEGDRGKKTLYSPLHPKEYPNNTDCVTTIEAPKGSLIQLDFRNTFHIEASEQCKFDFLEVRDGAHGYSRLLGKFCGNEFPPMLTTTDRFMWLHFQSDENIEYDGFNIVYEFIPRPLNSAPEIEICNIEVTGDEGYINRTDIASNMIQKAKNLEQPIDCMWIIRVKEDWKIQLTFDSFKLEKPNECEVNFIDVFGNKTDIPSRLKKFCGLMADSVTSQTNVIHIRFFVQPAAINSTFSILFTAFRDRQKAKCTDDEYDCEDQTCVAKELRCNGHINCRYRFDEDECKTDDKGDKVDDHIVIMIVVFGIILGGMIAVFIVNCFRKLVRDHKIIREHIRQSKESKLDELGRHSTKISRENIAIKLPPRKKDSPNTGIVLDEFPHRYFRETMPMPMPSIPGNARNDVKREYNSRNQEFKDVLDTNPNSEDDDDPSKVGMCDTGCQTRESLFQIGFKNKVSPPQQPRFSTFGYDSVQSQTDPNPPNSKSSSAKPTAKTKKTVATTIEMEDVGIGPTHIPEIPQQKHQHHSHQHHQHHKKPPKIEESRLVLDIRNSAPDVIIMTSSH